MTTAEAIEAIRVASFEAPKAHSHTEWAARIEAVLTAHRSLQGPARYMLFAHRTYYPAGGAADRVDRGFDSVAGAEEYLGATGRLPRCSTAHLLDTVEGLIVRDWKRDGEKWRGLTPEEAERAHDWRHDWRARTGLDTRTLGAQGH